MYHDNDNGNQLYYLLNQLPEAILIVNQTGTIQFANQSACELTGIPLDEYQDKKIKIPKDQNEVFEYDFHLKDNRTITTQITLSEFNWNNKKAYLSLLHDITQQNFTLEALENSKEIFLQVTQSSNDAICIADENGEILFFNINAEKLFGLPTEEAIGSDIRQILPQIDQNLIDSILKRSPGESRDEKLIYQTSINQMDRPQVIISYSLRSFLSGSRPVILATFQDITRLVNLEEKAESVVSERDDLAGQIQNLSSANQINLDKIKQLEQENDDRQNESNILKQKVEALSDQLHPLEEQYQQICKQHDELLINAKQTQQELLNTRKETDELNERLSVISDERDRLENIIYDNENIIRQTQQEIKQLQDTLTTSKDQLVEVNKQREIQDKQISSLSRERDEFQQKLDNTLIEKKHLQEESQILSKERDRLLDDTSKLKIDNERLQNNVSQYQNEVGSLENQISTLTTERDRLSDNLNSLLDDTSKLQIDNERLQNSVSQYQNEVGSLENQISTLTTERDRLSDNLNSLLDDTSKLKNDNKRLQTSVSQYQNEVGSLENQISTLIVERDRLSDNLNSLLDDNKYLKNDIEKITEQKSQIQQELVDVTTDLETTRVSLDTYQNALTSLPGKMLILKQQGEIIWCNQAILDGTDRNMQDVIGKDIRLLSEYLISPDINSQFWDEFLSDHHEPWSAEIHDENNKTHPWQKINIHSQYAGNNSHPFFIIHIDDISIEKNLENEHRLLTDCIRVMLELSNTVSLTLQQIMDCQISQYFKASHKEFSKSYDSEADDFHPDKAQQKIISSFVELLSTIKDINDCGIYLFDLANLKVQPSPDNRQKCSNLIAGFLSKQEISKKHPTGETRFFSKSALSSFDRDGFIQSDIHSLACLPVIKDRETVYLLVITSGQAEEIAPQYQSTLKALTNQVNHVLSHLNSHFIQQEVTNNLDTLFESQNIVQMIVEPEGKILKTTLESKTALGYSQDELSERTVYQLLAEGQGSTLRFPGKLGQSISIDINLINKAGNEMPYRAHMVNVQWNDKPAILISCFDLQQEISAKELINTLKTERQVIQEAIDSLSNGKKWQTDIWFVFKEAARMLNPNRMFFYQIQNENNQHDLTLVQEWSDGQIEMRSKKPDFFEFSLTESQMKTLQELLNNNLSTAGTSDDYPQEIREIFIAPPAKWMCLVPIIIQKKMLGILGIDFIDEKVNLDPQYTPTLQAIAGLVGFNIQKQLIEQKYDELKQKINDIVQERILALNQAYDELKQEFNLLKKAGGKQLETIQRFHSLTDYLSFACIIIDENFIIQEVRLPEWKHVDEIFGNEIKPMMPFLDLVSSTDRSFYENTLQNVFQGKSSKIEILIDHAEKSTAEKKWYAFSFHPESNNNDHPLIAVLIIQDITQNKLALLSLQEENARLLSRINEQVADISAIQAKLSLATQTEDRFLTSISQGLRNPLYDILNNSESLLGEIHGPITPRQQQSLTAILEKGRYLQELINDILDLAQLEAGRMSLELNPEDISVICQQCYDRARDQLKDKRISISMTVDENLPHFHVDARKLKQMINYLLENAISFTDNGGKIGLEIHHNKEEHTIGFSVWDTGTGINPEDIQFIFQPFTQSNKHKPALKQKSGLGLALAFRLADLHGGSLQLESKPKTGNRFCISLPTDTPIYNSGSYDLPEDTPQRKTPTRQLLTDNEIATILLVEKNELTISYYTDFLFNQGFQVLLARNLQEAFDQTNQFHPALMIIGLDSPGTKAIETIKQMQQDQVMKDIPVIALSALALPGDDKLFHQAGINDSYLKPLFTGKLLQVIQSILKPDEVIQEVTGDKKQNTDY